MLLRGQHWKIAFAYIGIIIGAGLSSGQDLLQYFLCFGRIGLLGVALLGILNVIFGKIMVTFGSYYRSDNHEEVFTEIAHPVITRLLDLVLVIGSFVMGFVMVAGAGSNLQQQFGIPTWIGALICSGLILMVAFLDFDKITGVLGGFTPVMIVMILLITVYTFFGKSYDFTMLDHAARTIQPAMGNVWLSVINYYALCAMTGVSMAFILGGSVVRIGVAEKGGTLGGALIGLIVMAASLALFANIDVVKDTDMPMLSIVNRIHPALAMVYALTIFALIFNTAFSLYYSIARRYSKGSTKRMRILMAGIVAAGYLCSFGGFKQLIGMMYPILGYMGVLLLVILLTGWVRERSSVTAEKFFRRKLIRISLKKQAPDRTVTPREQKLFQTLVERSPADTDALREDIHATARQIAEQAEDIRSYVETHLSVDDDKLQQTLAEQQGK